MKLSPPATRYVYAVRAIFSSPQEEAAWNAWYDGHHVPELLSVPGFVSATRYRQLDAPGHYLALYEIESPEVFSEARYTQITGWGEWASKIADWTRTIYTIDDTLPVVDYVRRPAD